MKTEHPRTSIAKRTVNINVHGRCDTCRCDFAKEKIRPMLFVVSNAERPATSKLATKTSAVGWRAAVEPTEQPSESGFAFCSVGCASTWLDKIRRQL